MKRYGMTGALLCAAVFLSCFACAEEMSVQDIVTRANHAAYYAGNDGRSDVSMRITDSQGRVREREFTVLRYDVADGGEQKYYVYFKKPEDVREMVYMVWKHLDRDDDRWLYLPALDLVKRVAAGDKRSSFAGSDFVYEDVSGRSIDDDTHELIETTEAHFKLKNMPKDTSLVEFAYYYIWIDRDTFLPVKAEYFRDGDVLYRTVKALRVEEIQGHPTVVESEVKDLEAGSATIATFTDIEYDVGLSEDIFTERYLRRAPRQWIR